MVIDFTTYLETQQAEQAAIISVRKAETAAQASLEWFLLDVIADINAA